MKTRKGVALIWVLVLSTVLLITSTTMVSYIIKESQFSVRIEDSTKVYAAAKSGIDWAKWKYDNKLPTETLASSYEFNLLGDDDDMDTTVSIDEAQKIVTSASRYNNVTRKLKYKLTSAKSAVLDLSDQVNKNPNGKWIGTNTESFDMQFDFWGGSVPFGIGVYNSDSASEDKLFLDIDPGGFARLMATVSGVLYQSEPINPPISAQPDTSLFYYRVKLKYVKDTAAKVNIETFNLDTLSYSCLDEVTLDLSGLGLGNLSRLYITSPNTIQYITNGSLTDGTYITIGSPGSFRYIDNIRASFISNAPTWTVTIPDPAGKGSVVGFGPYLDGTPVTLTASNTTPGYLFNNWYSTTTGSCPINGSTSATSSFIINKNVNCSANFVAAPILTVNANNSAYGTTAGSGTYKAGTVVSILATPATGYAFSHWSGCISSTTTPLNYTVPSSSITCTANFFAKVPIYRFVNSIDHLFTQSYAEGINAGYAYEGVGWYSPSGLASGRVTIYRFYLNGRHFYSTATSIAGWTYEGPAFYAFTTLSSGRKPVYQLVYKIDGIRHMFTTSAAERDTLINSGSWTYEGISFYVY